MLSFKHLINNQIPIYYHEFYFIFVAHSSIDTVDKKRDMIN